MWRGSFTPDINKPSRRYSHSSKTLGISLVGNYSMLTTTGFHRTDSVSSSSDTTNKRWAFPLNSRPRYRLPLYHPRPLISRLCEMPLATSIEQNPLKNLWEPTEKYWGYPTTNILRRGSLRCICPEIESVDGMSRLSRYRREGDTPQYIPQLRGWRRLIRATISLCLTKNTFIEGSLFGSVRGYRPFPIPIFSNTRGL